VSAANSATCQDEKDRVHQWAADNNLQHNLKKSKELLIMSRGRRRKTVIVPPSCPGVDRVTSVTALGIQLTTV